MNTRSTLITASLIAASLISGAAQAALIGRDLNGSLDSFEAYYDTDLDITWLANANVNGTMNWAAANTWAANLSLVDAVNNITYDNWRLPTTLQPDASCEIQSGGISSGYGCTGSEMGHLFYSELGGTAGLSILTSSDSDLANFTNLQAYVYWSATEPPNTSYAWNFYFHLGLQGADYKTSGFYALAVSPGDVGASNGVPELNGVPEPATLLLVGLGLVGLGAMRRRG